MKGYVQLPPTAKRISYHLTRGSKKIFTPSSVVYVPEPIRATYVAVFWIDRNAIGCYDFVQIFEFLADWESTANQHGQQLTELRKTRQKSKNQCWTSWLANLFGGSIQTLNMFAKNNKLDRTLAFQE